VLRELRGAGRRSQEDVAREVGLALGSYARVERGNADPKWSTLRRIAGALGVSLADLRRTAETTPPATTVLHGRVRLADM
jgi:transcriptional regulator with XRE-family HTH domain